MALGILYSTLLVNTQEVFVEWINNFQGLFDVQGAVYIDLICEAPKNYNIQVYSPYMPEIDLTSAYFWKCHC